MNTGKRWIAGLLVALLIIQGFSPLDLFQIQKVYADTAPPVGLSASEGKAEAVPAPKTKVPVKKVQNSAGFHKKLYDAPADAIADVSISNPNILSTDIYKTDIAIAPAFSPGSGTYTTPQTVILSSSTTGSAIYYTLDGSDPTTGSAIYLSPIEISKTTTVKAVAVKEGMAASETASSNYIIQNSAVPSAPTNLTLLSTSSSSIMVSWNASAGDTAVASYDIYNGSTLINSVSGDVTTSTIGGLRANTSYVISVKARHISGNQSEASNSITVKTLLSTPANINCTQTDNSITLNWGLKKGNLALGKSYIKSEEPEGDYSDKNEQESTDGIIAKDYSDGNSYGYKIPSNTAKSVDATIDLGDICTINNIKVHKWEGSNNYGADKISISTSKDGITYEYAGNPNKTGGVWFDLSFSAVDARYVKVNFSKYNDGGWGNDWLFIDEIQVYNNVTTKVTNLALGKSYVKSEQPESDYFDNSNQESTDGTLAGDYSDYKSYGYRIPANTTKSVDVTVDLGGVLSVNNVKVHRWEGFINYGADKISIYTSSDGVNYQLAGSPNKTDGIWLDLSFSAIDARYIKVNFSKYNDGGWGNDWLFIDEIQAYNQENTNQITEVTNLALDKSYSKSEQPEGDYSDNNKESTDGILASDFTDGKSYGYKIPVNTTKTVDVTVDLGSIYPVNNVKVHKWEGSNNYGADKISIYTSRDGLNYNLAGSPNKTDDIWRELSFAATDAQYIKVNFSKYNDGAWGNDWLFIDEIQVYNAETSTTESAITYEVEADGTVFDNGIRTTFIHDNLKADTQHTYRIRAKNTVNFGEWSTPISTYTLLSAPDKLAATPSSTSVELTWVASAGATGYEIYRDDIKIATSEINSFSDSGLKSEEVYKYKVKAYNNAGKLSAFSDALTVKTTASVPDLLVIPPQIISGVRLESGKTYTGFNTYITKSELPAEMQNFAKYATIVSDTPFNVAKNGISADYANQAYDYYEPFAMQWVESAGSKNALVVLYDSDKKPLGYLETTLNVNEKQSVPVISSGIKLENCTESLGFNTIIDRKELPENMQGFSKMIVIPSTEAFNTEKYGIWDSYANYTIDYKEPYYTSFLQNKGSYNVFVALYDSERNALGYLETTVNVTGVSAPPMAEVGIKFETSTKFLGLKVFVNKSELPENMQNFARIYAYTSSTPYNVAEKGMLPYMKSYSNEYTLDGYSVWLQDVGPANILVVLFDNDKNVIGYYEKAVDIPRGLEAPKISSGIKYEISSDSSKITATITRSEMPAQQQGFSKIYTMSSTEPFNIEKKGLFINPDYSYSFNDAYPTCNFYLSKGTWYMLIVLFDDQGKPVAYSEKMVNLGAVNIPSNLKSQSTTNAITLSWDTDAFATEYEIEMDGVASKSTSASKTFENLSQNTKHTFRVRTKNADGFSGWSDSKEVWTLFETPGNLTISEGSNSAELKWDSVQGAEIYEIKYGDTIVETSNNSYVFDNLTPRTEYRFKIRAKSSNNFGEWSNEVIKYATVEIPQNITADAKETGIVLKWSCVSGASDYEVEADGNVTSRNLYNLIFEHKNLLPNTKHVYRVRVIGGKWSQPVEKYTLLETPKNLTASEQSPPIELKWDSVNGATSYDVYRNNTFIKTVDSNYFTDFSVANYTTYTYKIIAKNEFTESTASTISATSRKDTKAPSAPGKLTCVNTTATTAELTWEPSVDNIGVTDYVIYRCYNQSGDRTFIGTTNGKSSYVVTNLTENNVYKFTVAALDAQNNKSQESSIYVLIGKINDVTPPSKLYNLTAGEITATSVTLSWSEASDDYGVQKYDIYCGETLMGSTSEKKYTCKDLTADKVYSFKVKAVDFGGNISPESSITVVTDVTPPSIPANLVSTDITSTSVSFSWDASMDNHSVTGYVIYCGDSVIGSSVETKYTHSNLIPDIYYNFTVKAKDGTGLLSEASNTLTVKTKIHPCDLSADIKNNTIILKWNSHPVASAYNIYRDGKLIDKTSALTYTDSAVLSETPYLYTVKPVNSEGAVLSESNSVQVNIPLEKYISNLYFVLTKDTTFNELTLNEKAVLDLNGYQLTVKGNVKQLGGIIRVNGGRLIINGDYSIQKNKYFDNVKNKDVYTGILEMTKESDYVFAGGNFFIAGANETGLLTAGTMEVKGNFVQYSSNLSDTCFDATGTHKVILSGDNLQKVQIKSPDASGFNKLILSNSSNNYSFETVVIKTFEGTYNVGSTLDLYKIGAPLSGDIVINGDLKLNPQTNIDLNGHKLTINGNLTMNGGIIDVNGGQLIVKGNAAINQSYYLDKAQNKAFYTGILKMIKESDYVLIGGNFTTAGADETALLTAGTMEIKGNFTQSDSKVSEDCFNATGTHKVILSGNAMQNVSFANPNTSGFNILVLRNTLNSYSFSVLSIKIFEGTYNAGRLGLFKIGAPLASDVVINGDLALAAEANLDLNGHKLTVNGNLTLNGGIINVNGGELKVKGNLEIKKSYYFDNAMNTYVYTGLVKMTNESDYVLVEGNFTAGGTSSTNMLTAGTLELKGDFMQKWSNYMTSTSPSEDCFNASGTHKVILSGHKTQSVDFATPNVSGFNVLTLNNASNSYSFSNIAIKTFEGTYNVGSKLDIYKIGTPLASDVVINGDLALNPSTNIDLNGHKLTVNGNLILFGGIINVNGGELIVKKNLEIKRAYYFNSALYTYVYTGLLKMTNDSDYVLVEGNFDAGGTSSTNMMTAGTLELKGNFIQRGTNWNTESTPDSSCFNASGTHKVVLSGENLQTITFITPEYSKFKTIIIKSECDFEPDLDVLLEQYWKDYGVTVIYPPTKPPVFYSPAATNTTISLVWACANATGFEIYRNGNKITEVSGNYYIDKGLTPNTEYVYTIRGFDNYGYFSEMSDSITVMTGSNDGSGDNTDNAPVAQGIWTKGDSNRPVPVQLAIMQKTDDWFDASSTERINIEGTIYQIRKEGLENEFVKQIECEFVLPDNEEYSTISGKLLRKNDAQRTVWHSSNVIGQKLLSSLQVVDKAKEATALEDDILTLDEWTRIRNVSHNLKYMRGTLFPEVKDKLDISQWGSVSKDSITNFVTDKELVLAAATGWVTIGSEASALLNHYRDNTGTLEVIDFRKMNGDSKEAAQYKNSEIDFFKEAADDFAIEGETVELVSIQERIVDDVDDVQNWLFSIGSYETWGQGTVAKHNGTAQCTFTYNLRDVYDFHEYKNGEYQILAGIVPNKDVADLYRAGDACYFNVHGHEYMEFTMP